MKELELVIERGSIESGRTLSAEAVNTSALQVALWIAHSLAEQWEATGVPPTRVVLRVEIQ